MIKLYNFKFDVPSDRDLNLFAEGGVYFSEQQFINAGAEGVDANITPQQAVARFGEFIRNFQEDRTTNIYPYAYVSLIPLPSFSS